MFLSREAIDVWAKHLGLKIVDLRDGADHFIPLPASIALESGVIMNEFGWLGQASCVLERM
jgi:hypothetical protein